MFMAPSMQPAAPPQQAAPSAQPAPARASQRPGRAGKKKPNYIPLLIILGFVFLMALTIVLFFALRK
jgi:hypothetical protein